MNARFPCPHCGHPFTLVPDGDNGHGPAPAPAPAGDPPAIIVSSLGPDFRSCVWQIGGREERYTFTPQQAQVIEILWDAYRAGRHAVGIGYILANIDTDCAQASMTNLFRRHPALGKLIVNAGVGLWRLADPSSAAA
jgi:hypothetical protein